MHIEFEMIAKLQKPYLVMWSTSCVVYGVLFNLLFSMILNCKNTEC